MKRLSNLGEFSWLRKLLPRLFWPESLRPQLCIGPGDDAGVLRISRNKVLVATTDAMVEGVHFEPKWFQWQNLGEKVLAVNLSDLAAMGDVKPLAALVTVAFPGDTPVDNVDKFYRGLERCARRWKTGLLGGDTVGSPKGWFVSVTVLGEANPSHLIQRKSAKAGHYIVATGPLGLAAAGLEVLQNGQQEWSWTHRLVRSFCQPSPRFDAGWFLGASRLASSLMDCSDGLGASVRHLSESSHLGAEIYLSDLPISPVLERWSRHTKRPAWDYILWGGEDYELIFTVDPRLWTRIQQAIPNAAIVGRMLAHGKGCWVVGSGGPTRLASYGYSHFQEC